MSCVISDACPHCRTIFVCKGHCPYSFANAHQSNFIDSAGCGGRSVYVERNSFWQRPCCQESSRHLSQNACLGRPGFLERSGFMDQTRCLGRHGICPRHESEFKQHPTPFGIRHILGLGDTETSHRNEVSDSNGLHGTQEGMLRKDLSSIGEADDETDAFRNQKKTRTTFTGKQLYQLEKKFSSAKYLSRMERQELAMNLNITHVQVKTWFQNRRTKWKKESKCDKNDDRLQQHLQVA